MCSILNRVSNWYSRKFSGIYAIFSSNNLCIFGRIVVICKDAFIVNVDKIGKEKSMPAEGDCPVGSLYGALAFVFAKI